MSHPAYAPSPDVRVSVEVSFLAWGDDVVELYCLPETRANPALNAGPGFWRLRAEGLGDRQSGPEGVEILPL